MKVVAAKKMTLWKLDSKVAKKVPQIIYQSLQFFFSSDFFWLLFDVDVDLNIGAVVGIYVDDDIDID